jgi:hypothetical protein
MAAVPMRGKPAPHIDPSSQQAKLLDKLTDDVVGMPSVYEHAQRNRDMHQKRLSDMTEDTLRHIQKARAHIGQQSRHVRDTVTSYSAKFDHDINSTREKLQHDLSERTTILEEAASGLESTLDGLERSFKQQHEFRVAHCESILGPIRDEFLRIKAGLEAEKRNRRIEEAKREKLLNDEVEVLTQLIDAEKFQRGRNMAEFERWAGEQQQILAKRQYQMEQETATSVKVVKKELAATSQERIRVQHKVIENIASFVKRYHEQLSKDIHNTQQFIGLEALERDRASGLAGASKAQADNTA